MKNLLLTLSTLAIMACSWATYPAEPKDVVDDYSDTIHQQTCMITSSSSSYVKSSSSNTKSSSSVANNNCKSTDGVYDIWIKGASGVDDDACSVTTSDGKTTLNFDDTSYYLMLLHYGDCTGTYSDTLQTAYGGVLNLKTLFYEFHSCRNYTLCYVDSKDDVIEILSKAQTDDDVFFTPNEEKKSFGCYLNYIEIKKVD